MPWQITRYSCPGTVKIKLCPVSARFFSLFFPYPPPFTLSLSFSLPVPFFILLSAGKCASEEEVGARRELLPRLLLSAGYWDWVNGADGWRRAVKMEAFVPPPLPRARWQRQPSLLASMQAPILPSPCRQTPAMLHPSPLHPRGSVLPTPCLRHQPAPSGHQALLREAAEALFAVGAFFPQVRASRVGVHAQAHSLCKAASCVKSNSSASWQPPALLFF